jgi:hypothetical protein
MVISLANHDNLSLLVPIQYNGTNTCQSYNRSTMPDILVVMGSFNDIIPYIVYVICLNRCSRNVMIAQKIKRMQNIMQKMNIFMHIFHA